jgi:hypothetical protein
MVLGQPRKMLVRLYLKNQPGMHVVWATWEAEVGVWKLEASLVQS